MHNIYNIMQNLRIIEIAGSIYSLGVINGYSIVENCYALELHPIRFLKVIN